MSEKQLPFFVYGTLIPGQVCLALVLAISCDVANFVARLCVACRLPIAPPTDAAKRTSLARLHCTLGTSDACWRANVSLSGLWFFFVCLFVWRAGARLVTHARVTIVPHGSPATLGGVVRKGYPMMILAADASDASADDVVRGCVVWVDAAHYADVLASLDALVGRSVGRFLPAA